MNILQAGQGELIGWHDPDEHRHWVRENKSRALKDKQMTVQEAVERFIHDGDFIACGGFGHIRIPMALIYEIIRQRRRDLIMAGKTAVHDIDVLIGAGCVNKVEVAYSFGHELRGLSPAGRRAVESGKCKVVAEISNAGYQWRFLAAAMGVPFIPSRNLMGTDTFEKSSAKTVRDPWSGKPVCLLPACYPDVAMFHVPRCDKYGNAQIDGILVEDFELARAARRLIVTTEEIVDEEAIRQDPGRTVIPFFLVDAVCEVPYGAHPTEMPYLYFFDEQHIHEWLTISKTEEGTREYFEKYVLGVQDFEEYLELVGGVRQLNYLKRVEQYRAPMPAQERPMTGTPYTPTELLACVASHILEDGRSIFVGTGLPMIASLLAQRTHAPNLLIIFEAGGIGPQVPVLPISVGDSRTFHRAVAASSMHDVMSLLQNGYIDYGFLGTAAIDPHGNINTTVIGDWERPKVRLPGSGGANDIGSLCWRTIIIMRQDKRRFVKELPFTTTPGYLSGPGAREEAGLPEDSGPYRVITQLGVYGFDEATKRLKLISRHPGVTVEEIQANSEFEIIIPDAVPESTPPTPEEQHILREIDPTGMVIGK